MVLPLPESPTMSTRSPGAILACCPLSVMQPLGVAISRFSKAIVSSVALTNSMRLLVASSPSIVTTVSRKLAMRNRVACQSAMVLRLIDKPPQGLLHLNKGADDHHQRAEGKIAAEVSRRCNYDRRDDREPAVTDRDPGELRGRADYLLVSRGERS